MFRPVFAAALMFQGGGALAATNFGVRTVASEDGGRSTVVVINRHGADVPASGEVGNGFRPLDMSGVARIGAQWGRVTSIRRSVERNRLVGGQRNSYHLSGRAIDIARRAGVRHADIAAAYRRAGYHLLESLDEGDHSHFAFGTAAHPATRGTALNAASATAVLSRSPWKIVYAPRSSAGR